MNGYLRYLLMAASFIQVLAAVAQEHDPETSIETIIESVADELEEGADVSVLIEDLQYLAENPLNLNDATESDLKKLVFLNPLIISNLIEYRNRYGQIYSITELVAVAGFTNEIIQKINPFVKVEPPRRLRENLTDAFRNNDHQLFLRTSRNFPGSKAYQAREDETIPYEGNPDRYYVRYKITNNRFSGGFISEKDPGEAFFSGSNKNGFDFYSFHTSLNISKTIEDITLGDFIVRSGQGLITWQGYSPGKSVDALNIAKTGQGIRPYTSSDENRFFRGVSTTLNLKKVTMQFFFSSKRDDANLEADDPVQVHFTSLQTSGYHRTVSEIADEKSVRHTNSGILSTMAFQNLKIGATLFYEKFGFPFLRTPQLYNAFYFKGTENLNMSIDYQYFYKKIHLFGEAASSKSGGNAFIQGLVARPDDRASFSFLFRHFDKNYQAVWGNAFSESTSVANETGFFAGVKILPVKKVSISAYSDFYRFPWITFSTFAPSTGHDFQIQADYKPSARTTIYLRFKTEEKEMKTVEDKKYVNIPEKLRRYRIHAEYKPLPGIRMRSRIEMSSYRGKSIESGILFFQDLIYAPKKIPLTAAFRAAYFKTDSYNSGIFAYENDVLYSFSIPSYYGKGTRFYMNLKYRLMRNLDCWIKIGHSVYPDLESMGSGYDEINGNQKTDVKFQLRLSI